MNSITQLEIYASELACAAQSIVTYCQNADITSSGPQLSISEDAPEQFHQDRRKILANVAKIQVLLEDSEDFVQKMAKEIQMLASVQWLSSLQVLICLPLGVNLAIKNLAQLAGVQETALARVVRMTASRGFLQEPQPGQIMHTPLSSRFVSHRRFRDATMFLAECCTPSALHMKPAVQHPTTADVPPESGYSLAFPTSVPFTKACSMAPKLQRQWSAFLHYTGHFDKRFTEVLTRLDWAKLGDSCIVEVTMPALSFSPSNFPPMSHFEGMCCNYLPLTCIGRLTSWLLNTYRPEPNPLKPLVPYQSYTPPCRS